MKSLLHAAALAVLAQTALAEITVTVAEITDLRHSGNNPSGYPEPQGSPSSPGLKTRLVLSGPEFAEAKAMRVVVKSATDNSGAALRNPQILYSSGDEFQGLELFRWPGNHPDEFQVILGLDNPPRAVNAIKELILSVELSVPKLDPMAVITASVAKDGGKVLENEKLKAAGAECVLLKPEAQPKKPDGSRVRGIPNRGDSSNENTGAAPQEKATLEYKLRYELKDPNHKIASVEFCDANGGKLQFGGHSYQYKRESRTVTFTFQSEPPADAVAKIYLVTDKAILTVPLALKDIALP